MNWAGIFYRESGNAGDGNARRDTVEAGDDGRRERVEGGKRPTRSRENGRTFLKGEAEERGRLEVGRMEGLFKGRDGGKRPTRSRYNRRTF